MWKAPIILFAVLPLAVLIAHLNGCKDTTRNNSPNNQNQVAPENTALAKAIEKYLADNFGIPGAKISWYDNIKGISVQGDTVIVKTDPSAGNEKVGNVCGGVSGYVYSNENRASGLRKVRVYGIDDKLLIDRSSASDKCSP